MRRRKSRKECTTSTSWSLRSSQSTGPVKHNPPGSWKHPQISPMQCQWGEWPARCRGWLPCSFDFQTNLATVHCNAVMTHCNDHWLSLELELLCAFTCRNGTWKAFVRYKGAPYTLGIFSTQFTACLVRTNPMSLYTRVGVWHIDDCFHKTLCPGRAKGCSMCTTSSRIASTLRWSFKLVIQAPVRGFKLKSLWHSMLGSMTKLFNIQLCCIC